jgi:hypothetical protein
MPRMTETPAASAAYPRQKACDAMPASDPFCSLRGEIRALFEGEEDRHRSLGLRLAVLAA